MNPWEGGLAAAFAAVVISIFAHTAGTSPVDAVADQAAACPSSAAQLYRDFEARGAASALHHRSSAFDFWDVTVDGSLYAQMDFVGKRGFAIAAACAAFDGDGSRAYHAHGTIFENKYHREVGHLVDGQFDANP